MRKSLIVTAFIILLLFSSDVGAQSQNNPNATSNVSRTIRQLLVAEKQVTVAVIVSEWDYTVSHQDRMFFQSATEMVLLEKYSDRRTFALVDRGKLNNIINELKFSQSGFVSDKMRAKIGQMTGATHIVDMSVSYAKNILMVITRLVDVESGRVLAVDMFQI